MNTRRIVDDAAPRSPLLHIFSSTHGRHVLVSNGSRVYDLDTAADVDALLLQRGELSDVEFLSRHGLLAADYVTDTPPDPPPLRSISLAVAQACNLGCTYCYAQGGTFGGPATAMPWTVARAAVDRLFGGASPDDRVNIAFLGGEPLINRALIRQTTEYAVERSKVTGTRVGFSITTNGTLVEPGDAEFFEQHGFAVTVSLDGIGGTHDRLRPFKSGHGSYDRILARIRPLLDGQRSMQVSARVTVTPINLRLRETLDAFLALGFHSVGFSPLLAASDGRHELESHALTEMLDQMIACGREYERRVVAGERYSFSNMDSAMKEIHRGTHRPYPCGAGAGYLGVSASGDLAACHRFVGSSAGAMGSVERGVDRDRQVLWLSERHVHRQEPCGSCWAQYLCGGGCHHEVIHRGRPACDYIRGWLHYCLQAYVHLLDARPAFFAPAAGASDQHG